MAGSVSEVSRETCREQNGVHGRSGPKNRPAGVRASIVAMKRVTSVEPRDAGKWKRKDHDEGRDNSTGESGGGNSVSTSWKDPGPVVVGGTFDMDRAHANAARTKRADNRMVQTLG